MAITKPRNRVVLFRLTEEEYDYLQNACEAGQARSISDFARARILGPAHADGAHAALANGSGTPNLGQVEAQLGRLHAAVEDLTRLVSGNPGQVRKSAAAAGSAPKLESDHA